MLGLALSIWMLAHSVSELAKGQFLVAGRDLEDPRFAETVILLVQYDRQGAMGIVINRPSKRTVSEALPDMEEMQGRADTLYYGGPVELVRMLMLIRAESQVDESLHVFGDVYASASIKILQEMIISGRTGRSFRVYAGYAGWAPGQLEGEVLRGDWLVLPADSTTIFEQPSADIWPSLLTRGSALMAERTTLDGPGMVAGVPVCVRSSP